MLERTRTIPFEEALTMTGFGKFNILIVLLSGGLIMAMVFETFSTSYLVPASACELGTSSLQQGLVAGTPLVGIIITSHIWGYLADTRGRKKMITVGLILGFCTGAMATFSPNWIVLCLFKLLSASAVSGVFSLSYTLMSECTPLAKRSLMVVLTSSLFMLSSGSMAVLAIPTLALKFSYYVPVLNIYFNSWRLLNMIYTLPCILTLAGIFYAYESPKYLLSRGQEEEALEVLRAIFVINTGKSADEYQVKSVTLNEGSTSQMTTGFWSSLKSQTVPLCKFPLLKNTVLIAILYCLIYFCINPYVVWLPYMADRFMRAVERGDEGLTFCQMLKSTDNSTSVEVHDCSLNKFAMTMVLAVSVLLAVLNAIMSTLMSCCGRKRIFIFIQLMCGTAAFLVNSNSIWQLSVILFMIFIIGFLNFGILTTYSVDVFPTYLRAMAVCLTLMVGRGTSVMGINILKEMLVNNCEASFYFFGGISIVGGFVAFLLPADRRISKNDKTVQ